MRPIVKQTIAKNNLRICQYLVLSRKKLQTRRFWVHPINVKRANFGEFHTLWPDLLADEDRFKCYLRMPYKSFDKLLQLIEPRLIS